MKQDAVESMASCGIETDCPWRNVTKELPGDIF